MDSAIAIMKAKIADEYIVVMLNDIRDLNNIASTWFQFATRGVNKAYRGQKLLTQSPANNTADIDTIIIKLRKTKTTTRKKTCAGPA